MSFEQLDREMWLAERLQEHGAEIFTGDTTREKRMARFRAAIAIVGSHVIAGRGKDGKAESYAQVFERLYGERLTPPAKDLEAGRGYPNARSAPAREG